MPKKSVIVYVDGFALYKGMLQGRFPLYKWLNLVQLSERLFWHYDVIGVKFFTALLKPLTGDPQIPQRQQAYWRALRTLDRVEIIEGKFLFSKQMLPVYPERLDANGRVEFVKVKRPEEKGSDVSLAAHLMLDAFRDSADLYAVATNDSD